MPDVRKLTGRPARTAVLAALLWLLGGLSLRAQQVTLNKEAYLTPPKDIADAVLALRQVNVSLTDLSPDGKKFLITRSDGMPTLERLACPCVYLAEMAFDPTANRSRDLWIRSSIGFDLYTYADKRTV